MLSPDNDWHLQTYLCNNSYALSGITIVYLIFGIKRSASDGVIYIEV